MLDQKEKTTEMKTRKCILPIIPFLMIAFSGLAQTEITGKVKKDSATVPYANVALMNASDSSMVGGASTGDKGYFSVEAPEPGTYLLRVTSVQFRDHYTQPFSVEGDQQSKDMGSISLQEQEEMLEEVEVEATSSRVNVEADKMTVNVADSPGSAGKSAFEVLSEAPGVYVDKDGNLRLNGKTGVQVRIDDKQTHLDAKELKTMLEGMSAENIENLEIITHPSAKYEAEGTAGIINIDLKKNTRKGLQGNVHASYRYNGMHSPSGGFRLDHKKGPWTSFLRLNASNRGLVKEMKWYREMGDPSRPDTLDQQGRNKMRLLSSGLKMGTDVQLDSMQSIGGRVSLSLGDDKRNWKMDGTIASPDSSRDISMDAENHIKDRSLNARMNVHYKRELDTLGSTFSAVLDHARLYNNDDSRFMNSYDQEGETDPQRETFASENPNATIIYSAKADLSLPVPAIKGKLEFGAKVSRTSADNEMNFYEETGDGQVSLPEMSDHFLYDEDILAGYGELQSRLNQKWSLGGGIRAEYTNGKGFSHSLDKESRTQYLDLFPSLFVKQKVSKDYQLNYQYSRRISRPRYQWLNPYVIYLDPYTRAEGNPGLDPQYSHTFKVTQTFKRRYNLALAYDRTTGYLERIPEQEGQVTILSRQNVELFRNFRANLMAPVYFSDKWSSDNTVMAFYRQYNIDREALSERNEALSFILRSRHTVNLRNDWKLEATANYRSPGAKGAYEMKSSWGLDLGVNKTFNKRWDMTVNFSDVFRTQHFRGSMTLNGKEMTFDGYRSKQSVNITLRYRFDKGADVETKSGKKDLEELERAGG